jgi:hypothetical protein
MNSLNKKKNVIEKKLENFNLFDELKNHFKNKEDKNDLFKDSKDKFNKLKNHFENKSEKND